MAAPPRVVERLASAEGPVAVLHRGRQAVYVAVGDGCVGVVSRGAAQLPCALRVARPDLQGLGTRDARITGGVLHLDGVGLRVGRLVAVTLPAAPAAPPLRASPLRAVPHGGAAATSLARRTATVPARALHLLAASDPSAVPLLLGRGDGLTPLGDDVLCGWLAACRATGRDTHAVAVAMERARSATTTLSAELLDCAARGEVLPQFGAWLSAVRTGAADAESRAADLLGVGHTSGAGLLLGGLMALGVDVGRLARPHDERLIA